MKARLFVIGSILILLFSSSSFGGKRDPLWDYGDSLAKIAREIKSSHDDGFRNQMNQKFILVLKAALTLANSFEFPFDSITTIGKLYSPDKKFRIYNWNLPRSNGTNSYYCLIQFKDRKNNRLLELTAKNDSLKDPETTVFKGGSWFGVLYYKVILNSYGSRTYYTLLGWQGISTQVYQKIIEVLSFDNSGNPVFGAKIFPKYHLGKNTRIIFSYSAQSSMMLRYELRREPEDPGLTKSKTEKLKQNQPVRMILFDQLAPLAEPQEGQPVANVPLGENFDGFYFDKGYWIYVQNIPARNY